MLGYAMAPAVFAVALLACSSSQRSAGQSGGGEGGNTAVAGRSIDAVLAAYTDSLMALPGVVGTAVALCGGEQCIKVLLDDASEEAKARIPTRLEGYRVVTEMSGTIRPR